MKHGKHGVNVDAPELEAIYVHLARTGDGRWDAERSVYYGLDNMEDLAIAFGKAKPEDKPATKRKAGQRMVAAAQALLPPFLSERGMPALEAPNRHLWNNTPPSSGRSNDEAGTV